MIIEFVGIPGSGKTYISRKFQEYINSDLNIESKYEIQNSRDIVKSSDRNKVLNKILVINKILNINSMNFIFKILGSNRPFFEKILSIYYFANKIREYQLINDSLKTNSTHKKVVLIDEGLLHITSNIFFEELRFEDIDLFFKKIYKKNYFNHKKLFVFIDSNDSLVRLTSRPDGFPKMWTKLNEGEIKDRIAIMSKKHLIKKEYAEYKKMSAIYYANTYDAGTDLSKLFNEILTYIEVDK
ncbi:hypothetical protein SAMN05421670_2409 [Psychrobacillus psychrotolerans]|uniref:Uncharacterized protein n=1 Tax=Psychrobacillus psychrotolerans TaxID=126156 RepID=A0A1I5Z5A7_9BACI|nr:hypothetical protein [Psychrobacillus psychrotolerans]SFQ51641.1 hypothetical protein SAMN05421670_2409 [Psychrobacillus psychrotolerans]